MKPNENQLLKSHHPLQNYDIDYSATFISIFHQWLSRKGHCCKPLPASSLPANLPIDKKIPIETIVSHVEHHLEITKDDLMGIELGRYFGRHLYGILGLAIKSSSDLKEALEVLDDYFFISCSIISLDLIVDGVYCQLIFKDRTELGKAKNFFYLLVLSSILTLLNDTINNRSYIDSISLTIPEPDGWNTEEAPLGFNIDFAASCNCIKIPIENLALTTTYSDPLFLKAIRQFLNDYLTAHAQKENLIGKIEQYIENHPAPPPNHEEISMQFGMSPRTLRRKLKQLNTTYQTILNRIRTKRAVDLLKNTDLHLYQVSERLGYKNLSNFRRAFKKWTGNDFRAYR